MWQRAVVVAGLLQFAAGDAAGGRVELSNLYNHAWRLNDVSYVLSNDAAFEPFRDLGVEGRRLDQTR